MQFSASADLAYLSQPDISRVNTPTNNVGDYFNGTFQTDLSYRVTKRSRPPPASRSIPRFSAPRSRSGNYFETILGLEARYSMGRA